MFEARQLNDDHVDGQPAPTNMRVPYTGVPAATPGTGVHVSI